MDSFLRMHPSNIEDRLLALRPYGSRSTSGYKVRNYLDSRRESWSLRADCISNGTRDCLQASCLGIKLDLSLGVAGHVNIKFAEIRAEGKDGQPKCVRH